MEYVIIQVIICLYIKMCNSSALYLLGDFNSTSFNQTTPLWVLVGWCWYLLMWFQIANVYHSLLWYFALVMSLLWSKGNKVWYRLPEIQWSCTMYPISDRIDWIVSFHPRNHRPFFALWIFQMDICTTHSHSKYV